MDQLETLKYLVKSKKQSEAIAFFESIPLHSREHLNQMIKNSSNVQDAQNYFKLIQKPNEYTLTYMLNCYILNKQLPEAELLLNDMKTKYGVDPTRIHFSAISYAYVKNKDMESAERVFRQCVKHDFSSYDVLIRGYESSGNLEKASSLFNEMILTGIMPDPRSLTYYTNHKIATRDQFLHR
jgi:pentatricopeptide repeat protein